MNKLMTLDQVAALFPGKNRRWVIRSLVLPRRVTSIKIGSAHFVETESLNELLDRMRTKAFTRHI